MKTYMPITVILILCIVEALSPTSAVRADDAPAASTPAAIAPIKSTRTNGMVVLAPDAALSGGRLVMRVVAYNGRSEPAQLSATAIHITSATGEIVALVPLEQLIREVSAAKHPKTLRGPASSDVLPGNFNQDTGSAMRDSTGNVVHGVNGGVNTMGTDIVPYAAPADAADSKEAAAKTKQQVAALKAGILQTLSIEPRSAAGAQIVTEKLNFAAKEERILRVTVEFNGEEHELTVPVPAGS